MAAAFHLRIARPVADIALSKHMYCRGLGLEVLASFEDHQGFDGVMLGVPGAGYHFELTRARDRPVHAAPTVEDLAVFYIPDEKEWEARCLGMLAAGFTRVLASNPYWERRGRTFEDPDGYRVVLERSHWSADRAGAAQPQGETPVARLADAKHPVALVAEEAPARDKPSSYPEPFASRMAGRLKKPLGERFGLANFGVNLTRLAPGAASALRHAHAKQDEFVYVLEGNPTLHTDEGRTRLAPGMCAGFKAGTGNGHRLVNETGSDVVYLEVGDRTPGDEGFYPDDDLKAAMIDGRWRFVHKDGSPY